MNSTGLIFGIMAAMAKEEYSYADLHYLTGPFRISENSLRTGLSRLAGRDYVQIRRDGRNAFYSFGERGREVYRNTGMSLNPPHWKGWNGSWWGLLFSLPVNSSRERYYLKKKLAYYRFAIRFPGFWIRPKNMQEKIELAFRHNLDSAQIELIEFSFSHDLRQELVCSLWNIEAISGEFVTIMKSVAQKMAILQTMSPEEVFAEKMVTGDQMMNLLSKDPLLPRRFLPENWPGKGLRKMFNEWDLETTRLSEPFWQKIVY